MDNERHALASQENIAKTGCGANSAVNARVIRLTREIMETSKEDLINQRMDISVDFGLAIKILVFNIVKVMCLEIEKKK